MFSQIFRLNSYERKLASLLGVPLSVSTILAGAARSLREEWDCDDQSLIVNRAIAADVLAPLLFGYACWIIESAQRDKRSRLYFMARDGLVVKKVVDVLIARWSLPLRTHYLYCSRESLMLPAYQSTGDYEFGWITWGYLSSVTLTEVCCRLKIRPQQLSPYFDQRLHSISFDQTLTPEQLEALREVLSLETVEGLIRTQCKSQAELTAEYLRQQGLDASDNWAIVDTGWRGRSQYALSSILQSEGLRPQGGVCGYYLGLNTSDYCYLNDTLSAFLFDWRTSPVDYLLNNFLCFELLFAANHERTVNYKKDGELIVPVFDKLPEVKEVDFAERQHIIATQYADQVSQQVSLERISSGALLQPLRRIMTEFIGWPESRVANEYGQILMASEVRERDMQEMAPPMTYYQLVKSALGIDRVVGFWPQASMRRGSMKGAMVVYNIFLKLRLLDWYRRVFLRY